METPALIKRLVKKYEKSNEQQLTEFMVKDLYAAEIVYFKKQVYSSKQYNPNDKGRPKTKSIKKFAIFYKSGFNQYTHIKSGQILNDIEWSPSHDYAIRKIKPLTERLSSHIIFGGIPDNQVLSKEDIVYMERRINSNFIDQNKSFFFD